MNNQDLVEVLERLGARPVAGPDASFVNRLGAQLEELPPTTVTPIHRHHGGRRLGVGAVAAMATIAAASVAAALVAAHHDTPSQLQQPAAAIPAASTTVATLPVTTSLVTPQTTVPESSSRQLRTAPALPTTSRNVIAPPKSDPATTPVTTPAVVAPPPSSPPPPTEAPIPAATIALSCSLAGGGGAPHVECSWTPATTLATPVAYRLLRSVTGQSAGRAFSTGDTHYADSTVVPGATYAFQVQALQPDGTVAEHSNPVAVTVPAGAAPPTGSPNQGPPPSDSTTSTSSTTSTTRV
jgi:hypothetical protein